MGRSKSNPIADGLSTVRKQQPVQSALVGSTFQPSTTSGVVQGGLAPTNDMSATLEPEQPRITTFAGDPAHAGLMGMGNYHEDSPDAYGNPAPAATAPPTANDDPEERRAGRGGFRMGRYENSVL